VLVTDDNGCTDSDDVEVKVLPLPRLTVTAKVDEDCNQSNGSITVAASGGTPGYSYEWNTVPAQFGATATGLSAGTYTVTVTDSKGCTAEVSETIINKDGPTVEVTTDAVGDTACIADDVVLTANPTPADGNYSYQWSDGLGSTKSVTVTNVQSTKTYSVTVTDLDTRCTAEDDVELVVEGCSEVTHTKSLKDTVQTGDLDYDVTYEIIVENIGTGPGEYTLLDSLAFDPDVVINNVVYTSDAPGNPGGGLNTSGNASSGKTASPLST